MSIAKAASMTTKGVPIAMTKRMKRQNRMIPKPALAELANLGFEFTRRTVAV